MSELIFYALLIDHFGKGLVATCWWKGWVSSFYNLQALVRL